MNFIKNSVSLQNIKNISTQFLSCKELITYITYTVNTSSKCLLLSGSPVDKTTQITTLLRAIGAIKSDNLNVFNPYTGSKWTGFNEFITFCDNILQSKQYKIIHNVPTVNEGTTVTLKNIIYTLSKMRLIQSVLFIKIEK